MSPLCALPEELLERIVVHALPLPSSPSHTRVPWLRSPTHHDTRLALLRVTPSLTRIATPLLYHHILLSSPTKATLLLRTLCARPELAASVRCLVVAGLCSDAAAVLALCAGPTLRVLDLTMSFDDSDDALWPHALAGLTGVRHLTLRKPQAVYLSLVRPRRFIHALAAAVLRWPHLETTHIAFKLSDDTPTSPLTSPALFSPFALAPSPPPPPPPPSAARYSSPGPISALTHALATAPALHTFTTHLPSVWNAAVLTVSANPALERVTLLDGRAPSASPSPYPYHAAPADTPSMPDTPHSGIVGTGLFLMEARRHPRLAELIRAGTPVIRGRAHTMGTGLGASASPGTPDAASVGVRGASVGVRGASVSVSAGGTSARGRASPATTTASGAVPGLALRKRPSGVGLGLGLGAAAHPSTAPVAPASTAGGAIHPSWIGSRRPASGKRR